MSYLPFGGGGISNGKQYYHILQNLITNLNQINFIKKVYNSFSTDKQVALSRVKYMY